MTSRSIHPVTPQRFLFLYPLMSYIQVNSTPLLHSKKLIRTCKYFFVKKPVIVVKEAFVEDNGTKLHGGIYTSKGKNEKVVQIEKMNCQLWIVESLYFYEQVQSCYLFLQKIYRFEVWRLELCDQKMKNSDLVTLAKKGTCQQLRLFDCNVTDLDNLPVPVEHIIELFPFANNYVL